MPTINAFLTKYRRILREGAYVGVSIILSAGALLLGTKLITKYVDPKVFGTVNLLIGWVAFAKSVLAAPVLQGQLRFYGEAAAKNEVWRLRRVVSRLLIQATVILLVGTSAGVWVYCLRKNEPYSLIPLLGLLLVLDIARQMEATYLGISRRQRALAVVQTGESVARPAFILLFALLIAPTQSPVLMGNIAAIAVVYLPMRLIFHREGIIAPGLWSSTDSDLRRQIIQFAIPLMPLAVIGWVTSLSDRYIIGGILGAAQVGIYAAGYGLISQPFIMTHTFVSRTLTGVYLKALATGDKATERKAFAWWLAIVSVISVCGFGLTILLRHWVARTFLGEKYQQAAEYLPWIAGGYALWAIASAFEWRLYARKQTRMVMLINLVVAITALVFPLILIRKYQTLGVAMSCPIYFGVMLLLMAVAGMGKAPADKSARGFPIAP
jgi:O-antigen/teichoic acid export membrane protein